jgi:hypothetical protein
LAIEEREEARKGGAGGGGAGLNGFVDALEVVPRQGLDCGTKYKVRLALPTFELMLLRGADGAAHDLKNVRRSAATAIVQAYGDTDHDFGA